MSGSQLGVSMKIQVDKRESLKDIEGFLKQVEMNKAVGIKLDAKSLSDQVKKISNTAFKFDANGELKSFTTQLQLASGQVLSIMKEVNSNGEFVVKNAKLTNEQLKEQEQYYNRISKLQNDYYSNLTKYQNAKSTQEKDVYYERSAQLSLQLEKERQQLEDKGLLNSRLENELAEKRIELETTLKVAIAKNQVANEQYNQKQEESLKKQQDSIEQLRIKHAQYQREVALQIDKMMNGKNANYFSSQEIGLIQKAQKEFKNLNATSMTQLNNSLKDTKLLLQEVGNSANNTRIRVTADSVTNLGSSLEKLGVYAAGAMVVRQLWTELGKGVEYIKALDEAYTDVAISMDLSREEFNKWTKDARVIAQANGVTTTSIMEMVKIYATAGETISQIEDKLSGTAMIQNITQWSADQTTSAVNSIISQYNLLEKEINGVTGDVSNAIQYMGDALIGISNSLKIDNVKGIQDMVSAIDTAGAVVENAGGSMEWFMGVTGTLGESMNASGSEVAHAMKMISARTLQQKQILEDLGESTENFEIETANAEKALNDIGVSIRGQGGELRKLEDILGDVAKEWDGLSDSSQQFVAEKLAGNNRRSFFVSMMENYDRVLKLTNDGMTAQGELAKANEVRVNSLAGQVNILTDKWLSFMDGTEPIIYGSVQLGNAVLDVVNQIGAVPTVVSLAVTSFATFNKVGKELSDTMFNLSGRWVSGISKMIELKDSQMNLIETTKINIANIQKDIAARQLQGKSVEDLVADLNTQNATLKATQSALTLTTIKTVALQTAMTFGLSLAITTVVSALGGLIDRYKNSAKYAQETADAISLTFDEINKKQVETNDTDQLIINYQKLSSEVQYMKKDTDEYKAKLEELRGVKGKLLELFPTAIDGYDNEGDAILTNIENLKELNAQEKESLEIKKQAATIKAEANYDSTKEELEKALEERQKIMDQIQNARKQALSSDSSSSDSALAALDALAVKLEESQNKVDALQSTMSTYEKLLGKTTDAINETTDAQEEFVSSLSNVDNHTGVVESAKESFMGLSEKIETVTQLLNNISLDGIDVSEARQLMQLFEDAPLDITNSATAIDFLKNKLLEMEDAQAESYARMLGMDTDFWNNKMKNSESWADYEKEVQEYVMGINADSNFKILEDFANFFNQKGGFRDVDLSNATNMLDAQAKTEADLIRQLKEMWKQYYLSKSAAIESDYKTLLNSGKDIYPDDYANMVAQLQQAKNEYNSAIKALDSIKIDISPSYRPTNQSFVSTNSGGSLGKLNSNDKNNSSSSRKETEKVIEDLELVIDRYYELNDILEDVNNKLEYNRQLQANTKDLNTRKKHMKEEIDLLNERLEILRKLEGEQQMDLTQQKNTLGAAGFKFDKEGNITNYKSTLESMQKYANSLTGDAKEAQIAYVNSIVSTIDAYTELANSSLPGTQLAIEQLKKEIEEINKEHAETIKLIETLGDRYYEIESAVKKVDNALALNQARQENANGEERVRLMEEEIALMKEKQKLLKQQQKEVAEEANELAKKLAEQGVEFAEDGSIENYELLMKKLTDAANQLTGDYRDDAVKDAEELIDLIEKYTEIVQDTLPGLEVSWEEYTSSIKEAESVMAEHVASVQKQVSSAIENELKKRTNAVKTELQKQKDLYNKQFSEEDWEDSLKSEQDKLDSIQQQINNLSRDTSQAGKLKLQQLLEEYKDQQKVIDDMIRDKEKENGNDRFQEEIDKLDKELEDALDPENLAQLVNQALVDGFLVIGDEVVELNTLMSDWLNETGDGLTAVGDKLRTELVDNLKVAQELMAGMGITNIGANGTISTNVNNEQKAHLESLVSDFVKNLSSNINKVPSISIGSLLQVEGNITEDVLPEVERLIEVAKTEVVNEIASEMMKR